MDNYGGEATYGETNYLMGYSQGGWATLSALEAIENEATLGINVEAISCGAGAYNLMDVSNYILQLETFPGPLYLPYFIYSHQKYGTLNNPLTKYFQEPYASLIPTLFDGSLSNAEVNAQLNDSISHLLTSDFIEKFDQVDAFVSLKNELTVNSVDAWHTQSLIRFYHGTADQNVPVFESENMYESFLDLGLGDAVEYFALDGLNHTTGVLPWGVETIKWFNELQNSY
jgi:hypothetical protein